MNKYVCEKKNHGNQLNSLFFKGGLTRKIKMNLSTFQQRAICGFMVLFLCKGKILLTTFYKPQDDN